MEMGSNIKKILFNIISSGLPIDYDIEVLRKVILLNLIFILAGIILSVLGVIALLQQDHILFIADYLLIFILSVLFYYLRKTKNHNITGIFGTSIAGFFFIFLIAYGGIEKTSHVWAFTYPILALFLLGTKRGTIMSLIVLAIVSLIFIFGSQVPYLSEYSFSFYLRFISAYITILSFSFVMEKVRVKIQDQLMESNIELKKLHKELSDLNKGLEQKVSERTSEIKQLLNQKNDFIIQFRHDIGTPLTPIVNLLPIIEKNEKDPKLKELLEVVRTNAHLLNNIMNKTSKLLKLKAPETILCIKKINVKEIVQETIQKYQDSSNQIINNIPDNIYINADQKFISSLFEELISNGLKYSTKGKKNTITIQASDFVDSINVSVKDRGIGLTSDQIEHIFEEFYKEDESRHDLKSTGLGLPICKLIVEKHGGSIWVEKNKDGDGATFHFTLPTHQEEIIQSEENEPFKDIYKKIDAVLDTYT